MASRARAAWKARALSRAATRNARSAARRSSEAGANGPQPKCSHVSGVVQVPVERLAARVDERPRARGRQQLVDRRHPAHDRRRERRVGQPHALAAQDRAEGRDAAAVRRGGEDDARHAWRAGPGHGRVRGRLRAAVAQVIARHEAAHAVAHEVETCRGIAFLPREALEAQGEAPRALHQVAAPVVGVDGVAQSRADPRLVARGVEEVEEVGVLGEPERPRQNGVRPDQEAGVEVVAAARERQLPRQGEVVVAEGVAEVEPGLGPVGPQELAAEDPGHEDHHRRIGRAGQRAEDAGVEPAAAARGRPRRGRRAERDPGEERPRARGPLRPCHRRPSSSPDCTVPFASPSARG